MRQLDIPRAMDYYRRAADDGLAVAGTALANLYRAGRGVPTDIPKAFGWYRWAADKGDERADVARVSLRRGAGRAARRRPGARALSPRAEQNHPGAINNVGYFLEFGRAGPMDLKEAATWYQRALQLGDKAASGNLGRVQEKLRTATVKR